MNFNNITNQSGAVIPFHGAMTVSLSEVARADELHAVQARRFAMILTNDQGVTLELIVGEGLPQQYLQMVHAVETQFMKIL